jgi:hypothetical protein
VAPEASSSRLLVVPLAVSVTFNLKADITVVPAFHVWLKVMGALAVIVPELSQLFLETLLLIKPAVSQIKV